MVLDVPIRNRMIDAKTLLKKNDLVNASKKMYEGIGAFKFMSFGFLSDYRVTDVTFGKTNLSNVLADLAFKIIMADDEPSLMKIMQIKTEFQIDEQGVIKTQSVYPIPLFRDKEEANEHYEDILNIILTYQDRIPSSIWRNKE